MRRNKERRPSGHDQDLESVACAAHEESGSWNEERKAKVKRFRKGVANWDEIAEVGDQRSPRSLAMSTGISSRVSLQTETVIKMEDELHKRALSARSQRPSRRCPRSGRTRSGSKDPNRPGGFHVIFAGHAGPALVRLSCHARAC